MLKLPDLVEFIIYCILIILAFSAAVITIDGLVKLTKEDGAQPVIASLVGLLVLIVALAGIGLLSYYS